MKQFKFLVMVNNSVMLVDAANNEDALWKAGVADIMDDSDQMDVLVALAPDGAVRYRIKNDDVEGVDWTQADKLKAKDEWT